MHHDGFDMENDSTLALFFAQSEQKAQRAGKRERKLSDRRERF